MEFRDWGSDAFSSDPNQLPYLENVGNPKAQLNEIRAVAEDAH